jgi:hypothetical protein
MNADERRSLHTPIPVEEARRIAAKFHKSLVIIFACDPVSDLAHVTTYGTTVPEKELAAHLGNTFMAAAGGDLSQSRTYEDYRFADAGQRALKIEKLNTACTAAAHTLRSLLAVRDGMTDDAINNVLAAIDEAQKLEG